jgi:hypothetical protein
MRKLETNIETDRHTHSIILDANDSLCAFEIIARDKLNNTKSTITNINWILSELITPIIQLENYETTIYASKEVFSNLYSNAVDSFRDKEWITYLEKELEKDKKNGEWEY